MDYHRIYREFIADRKTRESALIGYSESHHISPRCVGGTDRPDNLVRLTPEDHFFAHLLLAKIHGGRLWYALAAMANLTNESAIEHRRDLKRRVKFGHIRRQLADHYRRVLSGPDGKIADKREYILRHFDGREIQGNRFKLSSLSGVTRQQISAVLRGAKRNAHGWYSAEHNPLGLTRSELLSQALRDHTRHKLFHRDGRTWAGTLQEFAAMEGRQLVWQKGNRQIAGWYRCPTAASFHRSLIGRRCRSAIVARGDISGSGNPMFGADRRKDMSVRLLHKSGETYTGSLKAFADQRCIDALTYGRMRKTLIGKKIVNGQPVRTFRGWELVAG